MGNLTQIVYWEAERLLREQKLKPVGYKSHHYWESEHYDFTGFLLKGVPAAATHYSVKTDRATSRCEMSPTKGHLYSDNITYYAMLAQESAGEPTAGSPGEE